MLTDNERIEYFKEEIARLSNELVDSLEQRDALVEQVEQLSSHIVRMQNFCAQYINPRGGIGDAEFINKIIYFLDCPEQRLAQSSPNQCLAERDAEVSKAAFLSGVSWRETNPYKYDDYVTGRIRKASERYANQLLQQTKGGE